MRFEYDPSKSASNKARRGLDFDEAQALWDDPDLLEIPARTRGEPRFMVIGQIDGKHWSGVITSSCLHMAYSTLAGYVNHSWSDHT